MRPIYLDYNTTTPIAPRVQEAMLPFLAEHFALPDSPGPEGAAVLQALQDARSRLRAALGAREDHRIVFTGGGADSCRIAIHGVLDNQRLREDPPSRHVVASGIEHTRVASVLRHLARLGRIEPTSVPCDANGVVDDGSVAAAIRPDTMLVCVAHADHLTGVVQPIAKIAQACRAHRVPLHVDASVSFGKIDANVERLGADLVTISGQHVYAPTGVGALYARDTVVLEPGLLEGPFSEDELHAGPPNVPGAVALGHAAELAHGNLAQSTPRLMGLRDRIESVLRDELGTAVRCVAAGSQRLPNTALLQLLGAEDLTLRLGESDLRLPMLLGSPELSRGRAALLGHPPPSRSCVTRISVGWYTAKEEIDRAADLLIDAWERSQGG